MTKGIPEDLKALIEAVSWLAGECSVNWVGDWASCGWLWSPNRRLWHALLHHSSAGIHMLPSPVLAHA